MKSTDSVGGELLLTVRQCHLSNNRIIKMRIQPQGDTLQFKNKISLPFVFENNTVFFYKTISSQDIYLVLPYMLLLQADLLLLLVPHHDASVGVADIEVIERGKEATKTLFFSLSIILSCFVVCLDEHTLP